MKILVSNRQKYLPLSFLSVRAVVKSVLKVENIEANEVAIHFVTKSQICKLHNQFFNDPTPTDCISLPMDLETDDLLNYRMLGEIFVCPEVAHEYINTYETPHTVYQETTLYVVHGMLHLLGYDDIEPKDRRVMRKKEALHMAALKECNTWLTPN